MTDDRAYNRENTSQRERLHRLVAGLAEDDLRRHVNEFWTVAGVLGHIAFWDGRALFLAGKLREGGPFTPSDEEPEDVDWINDATRPLIHAIPPAEAARLALEIAEQTDAAIASLPPDVAASGWPNDPSSPLNLVRATHRGEHLDEIESALAAARST